MKVKNPTPSRQASLKAAIDHTRVEFAKLDGCKPEEVKPFHPSEFEIDIEQKELF